MFCSGRSPGSEDAGGPRPAASGRSRSPDPYPASSPRSLGRSPALRHEAAIDAEPFRRAASANGVTTQKPGPPKRPFGSGRLVKTSASLSCRNRPISRYGRYSPSATSKLGPVGSRRQRPAPASERALRRARDQVLLPGEPADLPVAERDQHSEGGEHDERRHDQPAQMAGGDAQSRTIDAALFGPVVVLERNEDALQRPQHAEAEDQHQRRPQHDMDPDRRADRRSPPAAPRRRRRSRRSGSRTRAGPSAESAKPKSRPQAEQRGASVRNPSKSRPCRSAGSGPSARSRSDSAADRAPRSLGSSPATGVASVSDRRRRRSPRHRCR